MYYIASISKGYFIGTKHLCVFIYIRINGEVDTLEHVYFLQYLFTYHFKAVLLLWIIFVTVCLCYVAVSVPCNLMIINWKMFCV